MTRTEIERAALALLREAKLDPARPINVDMLVRRLLKTRLRAAPMRKGREGVLVRVRDEWRIYLAETLPVHRARWVAAHEVAHWALRRLGSGVVTEGDCDALGAAIVAPRPLFAVVRKRIHDPICVAAELGTTQSLAVLREGEVTGRPVALVEPHRIVVRGEDRGWPDEQTMRRIARVGAPQIVRVRIDDEPRRVALMAEAS